ncbi:MAG: carbohydrate kinase, partial [Muribaculaceae bacterium]|nr:carbohydrate kinase [Muribaculaceae bacterium]
RGTRPPGGSSHSINFNTHDRSHMLRAAQEGIVFSFMYGMEIMEKMGMNINRIHAGNANMFLSPVFRQTLADVSGAVIELYDTDGAAGAAKGAGIGAGLYRDNNEAFATLQRLGTITPDNDRTACLAAYARWKNILNKTTD